MLCFSSLSFADYALSPGEEVRFAQEKVNPDNEDKWKLVFSGLFDLRFIDTDKERSFQDPDASSFGGRGNFRYGGRDRNSNGKGDINGSGFHLGHLDFISEVSRNKQKIAHIHALFDETANSNNTQIGLFEAYVQHTFSIKNNTQLNLRGGYLVPKVSLENTNVAWTSPYSITPSAINSWYGEELKVQGLEATVLKNMDKWTIGLTGALYSGNDGLGTGLSWRGWSMHDNYSFHGKKLRLRQQTFVTSGTVDPFIEVDNNLGHYGKLEFSWNELFKVHYFYLNNNGDGNIRDTLSSNWSWDTQIHQIGFHLGSYQGFELLGQIMRGHTETGRAPEVKNKYEAGYLLVSKRWQDFSATLRYDAYHVMDVDGKTDKNGQNGNAKTLAFNYHLDQRQTLMAETIFSGNKRRGNETYANSDRLHSRLYQLSYRMTF